jgi:hypothetical protein
VRAELLNADGSFVAEVEVPAGFAYVRFGERFFAESATATAVFVAVEVFPAPLEGSRMVE